jgi:RNA polymerase sigma-70 factor (sigma-E family)
MGSYGRTAEPEPSPVLATPDPSGDAVAGLYRAHALGLTRLALLLTGDRASAEDVVQESFLGLYRGWGRLRDPARAAGYLRTSVVNGCRNVHRRRRAGWPLRDSADAEVEADVPVWSAEAAVIAGEREREMLAAVARLPRRQREVLALRYYGDLGDSEIASVLGVSRSTVSSTASRALAALAHDIDSNGGAQ